MNHSFPDAATLSMMKHMYKSNASSLYYRSHAVLRHVFIAPPHPFADRNVYADPHLQNHPEIAFPIRPAW